MGSHFTCTPLLPAKQDVGVAQAQVRLIAKWDP